MIASEWGANKFEIRACLSVAAGKNLLVEKRIHHAYIEQ